MERKWGQVLFALFGVVVMFLCVRSFQFIRDFFHLQRANTLVVYGVSLLVAGGVTVALLRTRQAAVFVDECVGELEKVAWPSRKDVSTATLVVVVTVAVVSALMGLFDLVCKLVFSRLYG